MNPSSELTELPNVIDGIKVGAAVWCTIGAFYAVGWILTIATRNSVDNESKRPSKLRKSAGEHIPYF